MGMSANTVVQSLRGLIEVCQEGEKRYRAAAETTRNHDLRSLFSNLARQREQFADDLEWMILDFDPSFHIRCGKRGSLHTLRLTSDRGGREEESILEECERAEEKAVAKYREVLDEEDIPIRFHDALRLQLMGVEGAHQHVCEVRENFKSARAAASLFHRPSAIARV
jgi:uncharacterized protein (TIGR02284 family)